MAGCRDVGPGRLELTNAALRGVVVSLPDQLAATVWVGLGSGCGPKATLAI